jgi:hypothetical protein
MIDVHGNGQLIDFGIARPTAGFETLGTREFCRASKNGPYLETG